MVEFQTEQPAKEHVPASINTSSALLILGNLVSSSKILTKEAARLYYCRVAQVS